MTRTESDKRKSGGLQIAEPPAAPPTSEPQPESLDKVRDILFGGQMRDYDRRFATLEERLIRETNELREDVKKRLAALEQLLAREVDALNDRVKAEQEERSSARPVTSWI